MRYKEIWKDIEGYEGLYQVSNLGRVRSLNFRGNTHKQSLLKQSIKKKNGYAQVTLCKNGKQKIYLVHQLVALMFLDNTNNYPIINHKDENKTNNNVNNLEWCSYKYNSNYGSVRQRLSDLQDKKRVCSYIGETIIKVYKSIQDTKYDGYKPTHVCKCCKGKMFYHHGVQWKYVD